MLRLVVALLSVVVCTLGGAGAAAAQSDAEKADRIYERLPKTIPCHLLRPDPKFSFPSSTVAPFSHGCPLGRCRSDVYRNLDFVNIEYQAYDPWEKIYVFPAMYQEETGGVVSPLEHVAWIYYRARMVDEAYDAEKHANWHLRVFEEVEYQDDIGDLGAITRTGIKQVGGPQNGLMPYMVKGRNRVRYEVCALVNRPEPLRYTLSGADVDVFSANGNDNVFYTAGDVPTYLGHIKTVAPLLEDQITLLNGAETALVIARDVTPIIGTACSAAECASSADPACWYGVGLDAVSDVTMLIGFGAPAKFVKVNQAVQKLQPAMRYVNFATVAGNASLAGYYASQGEFVKALGRTIQAGTDLGLVEFAVGRIKGSFPSQKVATLNCPDCPREIASIGKTAQGAQGCFVSKAFDDLTAGVASGQITHLGGKSFPGIAADPLAAKQLGELGDVPLEVVDDAASGYFMATVFDDVGNATIKINRAKASQAQVVHPEIALFHELQDLHVIRRATTAVDADGAFTFTDETAAWFRSVTADDPAKAVAFKSYVDRWHADPLLRANSSLDGNQIQEFITRGRLPPGLTEIPLKGGGSVPVDEFNRFVETQVHQEMFTFLRERNSYTKQVEHYASRPCRKFVATPTMDAWAADPNVGLKVEEVIRDGYASYQVRDEMIGFLRDVVTPAFWRP